jgi:hypothetical protein
LAGCTGRLENDDMPGLAGPELTGAMWGAATEAVRGCVGGPLRAMLTSLCWRAAEACRTACDCWRMLAMAVGLIRVVLMFRAAVKFL